MSVAIIGDLVEGKTLIHSPYHYRFKCNCCRSFSACLEVMRTTTEAEEEILA